MANYRSQQDSIDRTYNSLQKARESSKFLSDTIETASMAQRLTIVETMFQALWSMAKKKGLTEEDLFAEIEDIMANRKKNYRSAPKYSCPACGKTMQLSKSNPFYANCMYCSEQMLVNPLAIPEDNPEDDANSQNDQPNQDPYGLGNMGDPFM